MTKEIHILITLPLSEALLQSLQAVSSQLQFQNIPARRLDEIPTNIWEKVNILYTDLLVPTLEKAPNLAWIQFHWAGIDRVASSPILQQPDFIATTMSGSSASQMAEYILTALLSLGHHLPAIMVNQQKMEWPTDRWERFLPKELRDSTIGLIGYGSIGRQVARLLQPFGATILAAKFDAMHLEDTGYTVEGLGDLEGNLAHRIYPYQAVSTMLKDCDFVVITTPLTNQTRGMISSEELDALKPGAYLIDVSRGGIIDQQALIKNLKSGKIAGAMLDVFTEEPLPHDNPLWKLQNVIITPHISGISSKYDERAVELFSTNLQRYLENEPLFNRFDPKKGY